MSKKIIQTSNAPLPIGPYSQAVQSGNLLFVSGQIAIDPVSGNFLNGTAEDQTRQVMENIKAVLTEAGMDFSHILKTTIYLKDMNDFATVNSIYGSYFGSSFPARETVQVSQLPKNAAVEISVIAAR